jgi:glutaredoxin
MLVLMLAAGAAGAQQIYRWVDANGKVQYSSEKPPSGAATAVPSRVTSVGSNGAPAAKNAPQAATKAPVKMYATDWCPYCRKAREYFSRNGIAYTEFDIEKSPAAHAEYKAFGGRGVPVIFVGEQRMNGYGEQQLASMLKAGGH